MNFEKIKNKYNSTPNLNFKTTIELEGKKLFTLYSNHDGEIQWESYGSTSNEEHTSALLELLRIGYEVGRMKTLLDSKRMEESNGPIVFG